MSKKDYYNSNENIFDSAIIYDDDEEFLQDIPYSSSSLDRSSIGSIPWADDAIKQNQLAWECVERMLKGEEPLPEEQELRQEIEEWQRKFPKRIGKLNNHTIAKSPTRDSLNSALHTTTNNAFDKDSILNLSLDSLNDDDEEDAYNDNDEYDAFATPTLKPRANINSASGLRITPETPQSPHMPAITNLTNLLERGLRITSVPLALRQRQKPTASKAIQHNALATGPSTPSTHNVPTTTSNGSAPQPTKHQSKLHMPPILNVLESKRRFLGRPSTNRSFVQLTHVQQVQSAAVTYQPKRRLAGAMADGGGAVAAVGNKSAWQLPLTAATFKSRFANNRNAIVLPSLQPRTLQQNQQTTSVDNGGRRAGGSRVHSSCHNSLDSAEMNHSISHGWQPQPYKYMPQWNFRNFNGSTPLVVSSTTPSTSGRSISAAVHPNHQMRTQFNSAFFRPYAATKFK